MADTIIYSRLQHHRGQRKDLPQPLLPGEIGFCTDTGQVFIGADPSDQSFGIVPTLRLYNDFSQTFKYGPSSEYNISPADLVNLIESSLVARILKVHVPSDVDQPYDPAYPLNIYYPTNRGYGYLVVSFAYSDTVDPEVVIDWPTRETDIKFSGGEVKLDSALYTHSDAYALAKAINYAAASYAGYVNTSLVYLMSGLVTSSHNLEIAVKDVNSYEEYLGTIKYELGYTGRPNIPAVMSEFMSVGLRIDLDETDNISMKYSLVGDVDGQLIYRRNGNLEFMPSLDGSYVVSDEYLTSSDYDIDVDFRIDEFGVLKYQLYGDSVPGARYWMRVHTYKWGSF